MISRPPRSGDVQKLRREAAGPSTLVVRILTCRKSRSARTALPPFEAEFLHARLTAVHLTRLVPYLAIMGRGGLSVGPSARRAFRESTGCPSWIDLTTPSEVGFNLVISFIASMMQIRRPWQHFLRLPRKSPSRIGCAINVPTMGEVHMPDLPLFRHGTAVGRADPDGRRQILRACWRFGLRQWRLFSGLRSSGAARTDFEQTQPLLAPGPQLDDFFQ